MENGERMQLKYCKYLKLMRNSREKTIQAELYGTKYFFTAQKRKRKGGGWEIIFLVSNMDLSAKDQVSAYKLRWPQEKINRTTKQKFGSTQCQAVQASKQQAHILAGFLAHSILEIAQNDKQKQSVDKIVNIFRKHHSSDLIKLIAGQEKRLVIQYDDSVAKNFQNSFQKIFNNIDQFKALRL